MQASQKATDTLIPFLHIPAKWSGVAELMWFTLFKSAPRSISDCTASECPAIAAKCRAVCPPPMQSAPSTGTPLCFFVVEKGFDVRAKVSQNAPHRFKKIKRHLRGARRATYLQGTRGGGRRKRRRTLTR